MKIGLSFSRCVRDIFDGVVSVDDILVIISRTNFDPNDDLQWKGIWEGYHTRSGWTFPEWINYEDTDEDQFRKISIELWESGKLHQPRQFGAHPTRRSEIWLEAVLPDTELEHNPAAKNAWDHFQIIAGLTNITIQKDIQ